MGPPFLKLTGFSKVVIWISWQIPFVSPPHTRILPLQYEKIYPPPLLQGPIYSGFGLPTVSAIMTPVVWHHFVFSCTAQFLLWWVSQDKWNYTLYIYTQFHTCTTWICEKLIPWQKSIKEFCVCHPLTTSAVKWYQGRFSNYAFNVVTQTSAYLFPADLGLSNSEFFLPRTYW
jgi:hypothetical protein